MIKKLIATIFICLLFVSPCFAASYQILGIGDSIMVGYGGGNPLPALGTYLGMTTVNGAVSGTCIDNAYSSLPTQLSSYTPTRVYCNAGINDIRTYADSCYSPMADWLTVYGQINTAVISAGAALYPLQITPECSETYYPGQNPSQTIKIWNANLEDWAYSNNLNMAPSYLDMSDTTNDDCLKTSYTSDGLHPNSTGDTVYSYLMYKAAVPTRSRDWGHSSYPSFGHDSFSWWVITGGSLAGGDTDTVTGYKKGGTLTLGASDSAVSPVLSILPTSSTISITVTGTGSPTISYRTSSSNFARSAAGSFTTYTTPFSLTAGTVAFVQIKLSGTSETTLVKLDWGSGSSTSTAALSSGIISGGSLH